MTVWLFLLAKLFLDLPRPTAHTRLTRKMFVWLDVDPGHDDAIALLVACFHPGIRGVVGVSTVHGNQSLEKVTINARRVLWAVGRGDIPVVRGADRPLARPPWPCPEIHGDSGLDTASGLVLPDPATELANRDGEDPADAIIRLIRAHVAGAGAGERVTIVATACLTNVALVLSKLGEEASSIIDRVVLMGGAIGLGNISSSAEFNILIDPEAASQVMAQTAVPVVMVPLEVTHTVLVTPAVAGEIDRRCRDVNPGFARWVGEILQFFSSTYKEVFNFEHPPLHDPCAVVMAVAPSLFSARAMNVEVETQSPLTLGRTCCDVYNLKKDARKNVVVAERVPDIDALWQVIIAAIESAARAARKDLF